MMRKFTFILLLGLASLYGNAEQVTHDSSTESFLRQNPQKTTIVGTVVDQSGEPVIGALVLEVGTQNYVAVSADGSFEIKCPEDAILEVSFLGFTTVKLDVATTTNYNIVMVQDAQAIDEVVVIGYGTTTKKRATGAVDQVKSSAISERSNSSMSLALQGTSPSLVIQQSSFNPNDDGLNINIRGVGTMNNTAPLYVIDGIISDASTFNKLNPNDVENISILKDAGSAAIYGSRSANGVILVTTKKGRFNQEMKISATAMVGVQSPEVLYTPVEGWENATLYNLRLTNGGYDAKYSAADIRDLYENGNGEYFLDQILQPALQQNYGVSISGGDSNSSYMISGGYFNQGSNFVGPDLGVERYNFRSNVTLEKDRWKFTAIAAYMREENRSTAASTDFAIADASRVPTYYYNTMYDEETDKYLLNEVLAEKNPLGELMEGGYNQTTNNTLNLNVGLDYKIIDGLTLKGVFGVDVYNNHRYTRRNIVNFYDSADSDVARPINSTLPADEWNYDGMLTNSQILLDFGKTFGKHNITALLGASNESSTWASNQIAYLYADPDLGIQGEGTELDPTNSYMSPESSARSSITSFFGRVGYDYDDKYIVDATFRYDGSSKFSPDLRWGFFPSVSLAWRLTEEEWLSQYNENVGDLKVRASYGTLGNQAVGDYQYQTTYMLSANSYGYNGEAASGAYYSLGSENITWEVSHTLNFGLDASFFNNSLQLNFDYYIKNTTDILVSPEVPAIFGTSLNDYNAGSMRTQGWELAINYFLKTGEVNHSFNFNIADSQNKLTSYDGFESYSTSDEIIYLNRVGLPLGSYYGYQTDGIFQSYDEIENSALPSGADVSPGDLKFVDQNGDGVIDSDDMTYLGNAFPRYTFGFTYGLNWRGFDFSVFFQGVGERQMMLRGELIEPYHVGYYYTMFEHQLDFWTPTNTDAKYPQLSSDAGSIANNYRTSSDLYLLDAAYLRLKNIQVGYTFPSRLVNRIGVEHLKLYVNAQNLFTICENSFIDPEDTEFSSSMSSSGANSGRNYPTLHYYGFGIELTF